ncbi:Translocon-associated protein subunit alpha [Entamoeba marina]
MNFLLLFLAVLSVFAQEAIIETPDENQVALLNITKDFDTEDLFTETNVTVLVSVHNPGPLNVSNVVIVDELPPFLRLFEGTNNTAVFDLIPVNTTVNMTYVAVPILSGIHYFEGAYVNFTHNRTKHQEYSYDLGEMYIQQYKGLIPIIIEWGFIILVGCLIALVWIYYKSRKETRKQIILRSKGYGKTD